ncbi:hypothetical protein L1987_51768 [Smallanthus sonchifolius]|uniref:Uncharacterized protein n=1 Tax=Smallanthus sonchifolius TaxID=185202 RepID=A0ACB9ERB0_9ASTR|nr:hypothetical protein L1987_51768 [Smallanthus sonchifolius]
MYTWILSTGWWKGPAPVNPEAIVVIGFLCTCLIVGFIRINRCFLIFKKIHVFCASSCVVYGMMFQYLFLTVIDQRLKEVLKNNQIYLVSPPRPAVGEEADLGVILFLALYFFLPHALCIISMNPPEPDRLPL